MCTYITETIEIAGSAKGASGWIKVTDGSIYLDHPVHAPFGHTLNIDFLAPELGPSGRVAVELRGDADQPPGVHEEVGRPQVRERGRVADRPLAPRGKRASVRLCLGAGLEHVVDVRAARAGADREALTLVHDQHGLGLELRRARPRAVRAHSLGAVVRAGLLRTVQRGVELCTLRVELELARAGSLHPGWLAMTLRQCIAPR